MFILKRKYLLLVVLSSLGMGKVSFSENVDLGKGNDLIKAKEDSVAIGLYNSIEGENSIGIGYYNEIKGDRAVSMGYFNKVEAEGGASNSLGHFNEVKGRNSSGVGIQNIIRSGKNSSAFGVANKVNGENSQAYGYANEVRGKNSSAFGSNAIIEGDESLALGVGSRVKGNNSVALGGHSVADKDNVVSVGSKGRERVIQYVDKGIEDTDAVNVSQLKEFVDKKIGTEIIEKVGKESEMMKEHIVDNTRQIQHAKNEARHVGALSSALAALHPMQYDPLQKNQVMAGVGSYRDKQAVAVGLTHYFNENLMMTAGVSVGEAERVKSMANVGITWKIGKDDDRKDLPERYKEGPISSIYKIQQEMEEVLKENKTLRSEVEELKKQMQILLERSK
ncbi:YadA-like family protein [Fusobacterium necrophorum]|uniref:YadA-like family protein n=1 Tax=Fusobacterium necrophorum TaxID=859 RepID=UPI0025509070|nr:YadA-like family protein [Fusobacterium necrophorum]MDK4502180.1 YadA-like family protein [Fusobacterium necrophorum]